MICLAAFAAALLPVAAQGQMQALPNDPAVKVGKLENGLTYYIRHNDKPAQRAEFYLATNVGAIQETPDQDGLAHFLEHMCFNGTKNFPGKGILNWLESIGASFGGNVNASTGVEETQYMLNNIPLVRQSVIDTCLLILHDYSHFVLNEQEELDKERGVIIEERRARRNAQWRMYEKSLPYLYGDSKYGSCTLIGSQENLETFKRESIVNFYETWYRPDLQAVIVVGDVDVDYVERKLTETFADIPAAVNPRPKEVIQVPVHESRVGIVTDPEATIPEIMLLSEGEAQKEELNGTVGGKMVSLLKTITAVVMAERFSDITSKPDAPFLSAGFSISNLCESVETTEGSVSLKEDNILGGYRAFVTEIQRMLRYGFTEAEVSRAKENILSRYESLAKAADTRKNPEFVRPLIRHFFDGYSYMEPQAEYELVKMILSQVNAPLMNQAVTQLGALDDPVIIYQGPQKDGISTPTESQLLQVLKEVEEAEIEAPAEEETGVALMDPSTLKGAPVKKTRQTLYDATEWKLKNGVKVVVLPTEHKKDQILFTLYKQGGESLIPTEDLSSFEDNIYGSFESAQGLSRFKGTELTKVLSGKRVNVAPFIDALYHGVSGSSTVKDLETAFQLLYLYFTEPRFDAEEYETAISQLRTILPNAMKQPNFIFSQALNKALYGDNPREVSISPELLDQASLETIERNYRKLFADAAGTVMVITGDVTPDTVRPLVEKYIGSLPKGKKATKWVNNQPQIAKGAIEDVFKQDMETPMTTVLHVYSVYEAYDPQKAEDLDALKYILDQVYTETLREDEGGTYGSSVAAASRQLPDGRYLLEVYFNSKPALAGKLRELAKEGLKKLAEEGPTDEQFAKTVENFKKNLPENRISNAWWHRNLVNFYRTGRDNDKETEAAVAGLSKAGIQAAAKALLESGNFIEVVMEPGQTAEAE